MKYLDLIRDLTNAKGAPGFEEEVYKVLAQYKSHYSLSVDSFKNAYLNLQSLIPDKPTLMLDAHLDEVAFMVKAIDANGLIRIQALGGWMAEHVSAQHFKVRNREGQWYTGICCSKPVHFLTEAERKKTNKLEDLKIDLGAQSKEEVLEDFKITVGQPIVPATCFEYNETNQVMMAKAFDNRIGCAVATAVMLELEDEVDQLPFNLLVAYAAQEEVGLRGATLTARRVQPDMALVYEGTPSDDFTQGPDLEQGRLGYGPQLRCRDSSYIANEWMLDRLGQAADQAGIPIQHAVREGGSNNAGAIHLSGLGVPCAVLGVPSRYIHTNYAYASYQDFKATLDLSLHFIRTLTLEDFSDFDLKEI